MILCTHPIGSELLQNIFPSIKQYHLYIGLISFFILVGLKECTDVLEFENGWQKFAVFPLGAFIVYRFGQRYFNHGFNFNFSLSEILGLSLIVIAVITLFKFKHELEYESGKLIFSVIYSALAFCYALGLPYFNDAENTFTLEPFFLFILIWSSDSFAYFCGRLFGKHKMAPTISPKKTWEGLIGGVFLTLILSYFVEQYHPGLRGNWMFVGFLISIFAPLGDLVESQLKRTFNVKDSGTILPGHGGILDRLDSFIICAPVLYLYFILEKLF